MNSQRFFSFLPIRFSEVSALFTVKTLAWTILVGLNLVCWRAFQILGQLDLSELPFVFLQFFVWEWLMILGVFYFIRKNIFSVLTGSLMVLFYFSGSYLTVGLHLKLSPLAGISEYLLYHLLFIAGIAGFMILLGLLYFYTKRGTEAISLKVLNLLIFIFVFEGMYMGGKVLWYYPQFGSFSQRKSHFTEIKPGELPATFPPSDSLPDVYFLLFDEMMNPEIPVSYGDKEASEWYPRLREAGFFTADSALSNYAFTIQSMPSIFNFNCWENPSRAIEWNNTLIKDAKVPVIFRKAGYEINCYSLFTFEGSEKHPENRIYIGSYDSFSEYVNDKGYLHSLAEIKASVTPINDTYYNYNMVEKLSKELSAKPRFNYIHFMLPHGPFVLHKDGKVASAAELKSTPVESFIAEQTHFTYGLIEGCIKFIRENNRRPAVIIVTGDHGVRLDCYNLKSGQLKQKYQPFHAVFFPDGDYRLYSRRHSLANTFRIVLNKYLRTDYDMLPHKSFTNEGYLVPQDSLQ